MPKTEQWWTQDSSELEESWDSEHGTEEWDTSYSSDAIYSDYAAWQQWYNGS
jgi:hypothetical protein